MNLTPTYVLLLEILFDIVCSGYHLVGVQTLISVLKLVEHRFSSVGSGNRCYKGLVRAYIYIPPNALLQPTVIIHAFIDTAREVLFCFLMARVLFTKLGGQKVNIQFLNRVGG